MTTLQSFSRLAVVAGIILTACTEPETSAVTAPSGTRTVSLSAGIPPASNFVPGSDNPYFPLVTGTTFHYSAVTDEGTELEDFTVTSSTTVIDGVTVRVAEDIVTLNGVITEHTFDWFAQDTTTGAVWYFGEDSEQFDPVTGKRIGREGSWTAGKKGAEAGIIMEGQPKVGDSYQEENAPGVAQDMATVLSLNAHAKVPYGNFHGCLKTANTTPLEPDVFEQKYYCPGVGLVLENDNGDLNQLISITKQ
jgi:hypothetical protein